MSETNRTHSIELLFSQLIAGSFILLLLYRLVFHLPVWVDEVIVKAFIFGAPVWIFATVSRWKSEEFGLYPRAFWSGAFSGLAIGGMFGFLALLSSALRRGAVFIPSIFSSDRFWVEFSLAFATAWWESLFFYGLILSFLHKTYRNEWIATVVTTLLFILFHAPLLLLRLGVANTIVPLFLLSLFSFGQAIVFLRTKSIATCVVSHAFWGMALLVYSQ